MSFYFNYSLAVIKNEKLKVFLAIVGIIIGIGVYGAIRFSNTSIIENFNRNKSLFGNKNTVVLSKLNGKISDKAILSISNIDKIKSINPYIETNLRINKENIKLIGIDVVETFKNLKSESELTSIFPLLNYKATLSNFEITTPLKLGNTYIENIYLIPKKLTSISKDKKALLVDISLYQKLTNQFGHYDSITLELKDFENTKKKLKEILPSDILVDTPQKQLERFKHLTQAFRINLNFLAGISLLVAVLLIYNTTSYLCLKRKKDYATLISIGKSPKSIFSYILIENLVIGIFGTLVGIVTAVILAKLTLDFEAGTISELYVPELSSTLVISNSILLELFVIGCLLSFFGSILPALDILKVDLKNVFYTLNLETSFKAKLKALYFISFIFGALAIVSANSKFLKISIYTGFISPTFVCLTAITISPIFIKVILTTLIPLTNNINFKLAFEHILSKLKRHSIVVSATAIAFGMFLGVSIMILSFRSTVDNWLSYIIKADLYISKPSKSSTFNTEVISSSYIEKLKSKSEIKHINLITNTFLNYKNGRIQLASQSFDVLKRHKSLLLIEKIKGEDLFSKDSIFISESASNKYNLKVGSDFSLIVNGKDLRGKISGIFMDYSQEHGVVLISRENYLELTNDSKVNGISLFLNNNVNPENFIKKIKSSELKIRNSKKLKFEVFEIFDETFKITYGLKVISILLATLVLINSLLMLFLERKREFMTMLAIGGSFRNIKKIIVFEAFTLSFLGATLGLILSLPLSYLLVFIINKHFFGWSVIYEFPTLTVLNSFISLLVVSAVIGFMVAKFEINKISPKSLRYE